VKKIANVKRGANDCPVTDQLINKLTILRSTSVPG
jgi:hypothetical protein